MEPKPPRPVQTAADFSVRGGAIELIGRDAERDTLDKFVAAVRAGDSQAVVVSGEAGVGKSALLDYLAGNGSGCRIARAAGVQSEMELPFAGLHQLCAPMLDSLQRLPPPQRDAVRTAFGMSAGPAPDRFLVGLGVLSLLSEVAEERPLVCVWSTTSSGSIAPLRKSLGSLRAVWWRNRLAWCSRSGPRVASWRG
jgi:hypothetical protein